jgi:carbon-monoxide dehydrogenase medium subunit
VVQLDGEGRCERVRLGVNGVAPVPYRAQGVEDRLTGQAPTPERLAEAAKAAAEGVDVNADTFASAEYRTHLATVFARRALAEAVERARSGR